MQNHKEGIWKIPVLQAGVPPSILPSILYQSYIWEKINRILKWIYSGF